MGIKAKGVERKIVKNANLTKESKSELFEESKVKLGLLINHSPLGFIEWDNKFHVKSWSKRAAEIFGWTEESFNKIKQTGYNNIFEDDKEKTIKVAEQLLSGKIESIVSENRNYTKEGKIIWCEWYNSVVKNNNGEVESILSLVQDISDKKEAEVKNANIKSIYAFISQVNQHISHMRNTDLLFSNICSMALKFGNFKGAWIGLNNSTGKHFSIVEHSGISQNNFESFAKVSCIENGIEYVVLNSGKYYVSNDIERDFELEDWLPFVRDLEFQSCMILPIKKSGKIIGTLNLYSGKKDFFEKEEISLLLELTNDITFALDLFEKEKVLLEAEQKILRTGKRFRALIEKSQDMKTLSTLDGKLLYGSPSIQVVLGYSNKEYLEKSSFEFIHPDDGGDIMEIINNPGKSFFRQQRLLHKNGNWVWCEGSVTNLLNEPGINALVSNFRDVTEKKIAETQREFDSNNLNALINNTNDLMWSIDTDFRLITFNKPFQEIIRLMSGKSVENGDDIMHIGFSSEELLRYKANYLRAFNGERFTEIDYANAAGGFWSEISYSPIFKGNIVVGTACHSRNITERKLADKALRLSESRLKEAQIIGQIGNWEIDILNNIHMWSDEFYNIFGVVKGQVVPSEEAFLDFIHSDDVNHAILKIQESFIGFENSNFQFKFMRKDGKFRYGYTEWRFEFDKNNVPIRLYGIVQDITKRIKAKLKLEKQHKKLIKTNFELDRFVYSVSHDLRSPLTSILGLVSLIEEETKEQETLEHVDLIRNSILRLDEFIKNILSYSRNNRTGLIIEKIAIKETIIEVIDTLKHMKHAEGIKFEIDINEKVPFGTDKQSFYTIIENLISNAIKYHKENKSLRFIKIIGNTKSDQLQLVVEDNGIGIPLEHQENIFKMFFRLSGKVPGSGIGLYIVKEIIGKLKGTIKVTSQEGSGTSMILTLKNLL